MKELREYLRALQRDDEREPMTKGDRLGILVMLIAVIAIWVAVVALVLAQL